jgi:hypothetical protein
MLFNRFKIFLTVAAGTLTGFAIYYPFVGGRWATALGILGVCVGYTIVVFGLVWSVEKWDFPAKNPKSASTITVMHCLCVAWIAEVVNFGILVKPYLPSWLDSPLSTIRTGRPGSTGFELIEVGTIGITLLVEFIWLLRNIPKRTDEGADLPDDRACGS